ncbi:MAG: hypothetical protein ACJLTB_19230 [Algoriphagus aquaeductus]|uniref:hypothetical protein n=1 Tax=Algoriphagus aquaeductus TaxID=475299 RepID=UPI00387A295D
MKKSILILILIGLYYQGYGQESKSQQFLIEDLMKKGDTQYKAGWIFLGGGTAMILTAAAIPNRFDYTDGSNNRRVKSFFSLTGVLSISTSIPLFLSSGYNGRTAAKLSLGSQSLNLPMPSQLRSYPSLSLRVPL